MPRPLWLSASASSACGAGNEQQLGTLQRRQRQPKLSGTLNGAGSSAQEAAQGAWTAGFQTANPDATVNYDPSGSGAGVEQFLAGARQLRRLGRLPRRRPSSRRPRSPATATTALEVPDYISPIAVVYNVDGVDKLQLSPDTAAKIFSGKITKWDDPAIKADNPGAKLPRDRRSRRCTARTTRAPRRTSPTTCTRPPRAPGPRGRPRPGRSSPVRAPTAPPA